MNMQQSSVCHRPDGLEVKDEEVEINGTVCHRPDGLEDLHWME